ncbi:MULTISPECIES: DNA mismatch repair endonuclease MutL [unclassified Thermosynechococcus]|uniref:DNA mismatch repair endonuclease MutL n=1 Tax=unclassified Thermosynechococcus TaxID=2622553 RepID=UPI001A0BFCA4|nr:MULTISPECIES: DNA mismatch repair endonuclease MutL [unclassified Thermosynechococcus]HIK22842.1 DNA mismatch repair endonuclease MutL [Thermosynechococcus sp. M3746_W2019_013]
MAAMNNGLTVVPLPLEMQRAIAAAETLDSLATIAQELVENALDAGASRIHLHWHPAAWHLEVTDNGEGIRWADLTQVALPYTSSKLPASGKLADITTLGFRGQSLHSLAQMAQLTICSRHREADSGWRVSYDAHGQVRSQRPLGMAVGTRVIAEHIFQNWPQRQQGANPNQVRQRLQQIALCFPQVAWYLLKDGKQWCHWPAVASLGDRLLQLIPQLHPQDLRQMSDAQIELVLAPPDCHHRSRPDGLGVAVNGRWVELHSDPSWQQVILEAFGRSLPRQRFPLCIAHLHLPPGAIDWSAEPQKRRIYLREPEQWQTLLVERIGQLLACPTTPLNDASGYQVLKAAEPPARYRTLLSPKGPTTSLPALKVVGQLHNTYIIAEHAEGIWLIEQHIAHERVLYEQIETDWQAVELEQPVLLESLTETQVQRFQDWGLGVAPFGVQLWAVRRVPALLRDRPDRVAALIELSQVTDLSAAKVAVACRSAIRNGTPLTLAEMQTLVDQWYRCRQPHTCPHGRPICLQLKESSLARFFRRHWVVGKSHGI